MHITTIDTFSPSERPSLPVMSNSSDESQRINLLTEYFCPLATKRGAFCGDSAWVFTHNAERAAKRFSTRPQQGRRAGRLIAVEYQPAAGTSFQASYRNLCSLSRFSRQKCIKMQLFNFIVSACTVFNPLLFVFPSPAIFFFFFSSISSSSCHRFPRGSPAPPLSVTG